MAEAISAHIASCHETAVGLPAGALSGVLQAGLLDGDLAEVVGLASAPLLQAPPPKYLVLDSRDVVS